ncbi:esterase-like activity of phytase family protein [Microlunatus spumicola]|uniref:Esterase-like activity of phytase family protein n=1 Tax=Microlunatus spumicola TaxID=81499 RepID=A0ABP6XNI5_9ACTN
MTPRRTFTLGTRALLVGGLTLAGAATAVPAQATRPFDPAKQTSISLKVYTEQVGPIGTIGGVRVSGDGFGSAVAPVPRHKNEVYGLTDRGPNVDGPDDSKIEPYPGFTPSIGRFKLKNGKAELVKTIKLRAKDGTPYNGQVDPQASTGETITDLDGNVLPPSPYGYDSEGLVALEDGTFWVSDEYGPFITHFSKKGRAIERLSPFDGTLPRELALRTPNRGMEGLTLTPDGKTLVGIMQSALTQADAGKPKSVAVTRIVTVDLRTRATHEYAYVLNDPKELGTAVSEIAALSATRFVVDERDGEFGPGAEKKLYEVDLAQATDVGPKTTAGTYDAKTGVQLGGLSLEAVAGTGDTAAATTALAAAGVTPVSKKLYLDLGALTAAAAPGGTFFDHDKIEGVAVLDGGRKIIVSNDSDFGISDSTGTAAPFGLVAKTRPDGSVDDGQFLVIERH